MTTRSLGDVALTVPGWGPSFSAFPWRCVDDLGARLSSGRVDCRNRIVGFIATTAGSWLSLLPFGTQQIALHLPRAGPNGPRGRLVDGRAVLGPVEDFLACLSGH